MIYFKKVIIKINALVGEWLIRKSAKLHMPVQFWPSAPL